MPTSGRKSARLSPTLHAPSYCPVRCRCRRIKPLVPRPWAASSLLRTKRAADRSWPTVHTRERTSARAPREECFAFVQVATELRALTQLAHFATDSIVRCARHRQPPRAAQAANVLHMHACAHSRSRALHAHIHGCRARCRRCPVAAAAAALARAEPCVRVCVGTWELGGMHGAGFTVRLQPRAQSAAY